MEKKLTDQFCEDVANNMSPHSKKLLNIFLFSLVGVGLFVSALTSDFTDASNGAPTDQMNITTPLIPPAYQDTVLTAD